MKIKAAGVLPYSKDVQGKTWFLLGREKPNASWGVDSGSWSEFGGSMNAGESPEEGAAREFFEESMGAVFGHRAWMENELKEGRYLLAADSKTPSGKGYRSFIKYVPFVDYPGVFARYKTLAKKHPQLLARLVPELFSGAGGASAAGTFGSSSGGGAMLQTCAEKTSLAWFSVDQMKQAVAKYKENKADEKRWGAERRRGGGGADTQSHSYCEPGMIPHIRRGFAMNFDHLLNTSWGRCEFQNDEFHFPHVTARGSGASGESGGPSASGREDFEIIETASGTLRPVVKTPRFMEKRPPVVTVCTEGYSFKKKKRRRRNRKGPQGPEGPEMPEVTVDKSQGKNGSNPPDAGRQKQWTVVTTKKKKKQKPVVGPYRPVPPVF